MSISSKRHPTAGTNEGRSAKTSIHCNEIVAWLPHSLICEVSVFHTHANAHRHTQTHTHVHTCTHTQTHTHTHINIQTHMHTHTPVWGEWILRNRVCFWTSMVLFFLQCLLLLPSLAPSLNNLPALLLLDANLRSPAHFPKRSEDSDLDVAQTRARLGPRSVFIAHSSPQSYSHMHSFPLLSTLPTENTHAHRHRFYPQPPNHIHTH